MTTYKFIRHKHRLSTFAAMSVDVGAWTHTIAWSDQRQLRRQEWREAVAAGIRRALDEHVGRGLTACGFVVQRVDVLLVDTGPDALRCAAAAAAWMALGHEESELRFEFDGSW